MLSYIEVSLVLPSSNSSIIMLCQSRSPKSPAFIVQPVSALSDLFEANLHNQWLLTSLYLLQSSLLKSPRLHLILRSVPLPRSLESHRTSASRPSAWNSDLDSGPLPSRCVSAKPILHQGGPRDRLHGTSHVPTPSLHSSLIIQVASTSSRLLQAQRNRHSYAQKYNRSSDCPCKTSPA